MTWRHRTVAALAVIVALEGSALRPSAQGASAGGAALTIRGDVGRPLSLSLADIKSLPRKKVDVKAEDGTAHVYEGVSGGELLKMAGVPLGQMRSTSMISYVLAIASDGYQVLFAVADFDPAFTASDIIVADTLDGRPLPEGQGPLRLIAPKDLRGTRSARSLSALEVVRAIK